MVLLLLSPQEYEEKLAKLQAEYNAEKESKAKLQANIIALQRTYESKLSNLENAKASRGSSDPMKGKRNISYTFLLQYICTGG